MKNMIFGWYSILLTTILVFLTYVGYFLKINWVRDLRCRKRPISKRIGKLPPVYPNGWFALLQSSQLKPGQVKHVSALGENFAVFRTEKGMVRILDAYCPHLGANMAEGGRVRGDCLECPFHKWLFRGDDGHCTHIPYSQQKVPTVAKTKAWKSCEVNQIIFVWYHAELLDPYWKPEHQEKILNETFRYQGRNEFIVNCHIQDIAENGADLAHFSAVHGPAMFLSEDVMRYVRHTWMNTEWKPCVSDTTDDSSKTPTENNSQEDDDSCESTIMSTMTSTIEPINKTMINAELKTLPNGKTTHNSKSSCHVGKHRAKMHLRHSLLLLDRFEMLELNVKVEHIGPSYVEMIVETTFGNMIMLQTVTPIEPLVQRICHIIFSPPLLAPYANIVFLGECVMFERDIAIWNHKKYESRPVLVREDRPISAYRKWYSQFYTENSPTYQNAVKTLQW